MIKEKIKTSFSSLVDEQRNHRQLLYSKTYRGWHMDSTHTSGFKHRAGVSGLLCSRNSSQSWEDLAIHSGPSHLFLDFSPTLNKFVFMIVHLFIQCGVMCIKTQTCSAADTAAGQ